MREGSAAGTGDSSGPDIWARYRPGASADAVDRGHAIEGGDRGTGDGASGGSSAPPRIAADLDRFTADFNRVFAAQLHVFEDGSIEPAAEHGPDVTAAEIGAASGVRVPRERLVVLFTPTQIEKLASFMATLEIPERLFNGDDVGTTTTQQRILLSGHILTTGHYQPGGFEQAVHARMCGHWVNLVLAYAGCDNGAGAGVREQFDHNGGLSLSVEDTTDRRTGRATTTAAGRDSLDRGLGLGGRHAPAPGARATFEMTGLPFEQLATLEPGDWLWIFNDNGSPGGNHSVIFSRWASAEQRFGDVRYRRAITMSQGSPDAGGREEMRLLGERFVDTGSGHVTPVTHVSRISASTRPMQTVEDLIAILGSGPEATTNRTFIERQVHDLGRFDWAALAQYLREQNDALIAQLESHMTPNQREVFHATNQRHSGDGGEGEIPLLVRLNERLRTLADNATALDAATTESRARIAATHDASLERTRPEREALQARIDAIHADLERLEAEHAPLEAQVDLYEAQTAELRERYVERRRLRQQRTALRQELRTSSMEPERRQEIADELAAIATRLEELAPEIEQLEDVENSRDVRADRRDARRAERHVEVRIRQQTMLLARLARQLTTLTASAGYVTAHGRVGRDDFNGRGESGPTGLLRNLVPQPHWSTFMRGAAGGAPSQISDTRH